MSTSMTAPVEQPPTDVAPAKGIRGLLLHDPVREKVAPMLPPDMSYDHVVAAVQLAVRQNPAIMKATPPSIIDSVVRILQWGLEIGVTAYLVPFKGKCTAVADYKGLAELMVASGAVRHVEARVVYTGDVFEYELGLNARLVHRPAAATSRGPITHAYVILRLPFGRDVFEVMAIEDIEAIRAKHSQQWGPDKVEACPPWYAKKTVVRQASKLVPKNPRLAKALRVLQEDELAEFGDQLEPAAEDLAGEITPAATMAQLGSGGATARGNGMVSTPEYVDQALAEATPEVRAQAVEAMAHIDDPYEGEVAGDDSVNQDEDDRWIAERDAEAERQAATGRKK